MLLSKTPIALSAIPPGIELEERSVSRGLTLFRLHIETHISNEMRRFCADVIGHVLKARLFDCSILSGELIASVGHNAWRFSRNQDVVLFLRQKTQIAQRRELILESACDRTRTQQLLFFDSETSVVKLGKLQPGKHLLACAQPEEIIISLEIVERAEELSINGVQINFRRENESEHLQWGTDGLVSSFQNVRNGTALITHLIIPPGLCIQGVSLESRFSTLVHTSEELTHFLQTARLPLQLRICSNDVPVEGFVAISLLSPITALPPQFSSPARNIRNRHPQTVVQAVLSDALYRRAVPEYVAYSAVFPS
jgi:hypothetical protein